jgi:hypothetical protein
MTSIDSQLIECLLNMSEGETLDFKREQYPLEDAQQKSEFIKDVLAFANAWKQSDAHILVGVAENPSGGRATVLGVSRHFDDASLQELVNTKTNVPVAFSYTRCEVEGVQLGVLTIAQAQERPVFLKRAFGRLEADKVYVRRGSSTAPANPDEVARMGQARLAATREPELLLELGDPESETSFGSSAQMKCRLLQERPPSPPRTARRLPKPLGIFGSEATLWKDSIQVARPISWNRPDPKELADYQKEVALLVPLGFRVQNRSDVLVEDLRLGMEIPRSNTLRVRDELPDRPTGPLAMPTLAGLTFHPKAVRTWVEETKTHWRIHIAFAKLQPHATAWSMPFWLGSISAATIEFVLHVHADNIRRPISKPFSVVLSVEEDWLENEDDTASP